jgi:RNA polymerase sigma factor (sigma-70 family)
LHRNHCGAEANAARCVSADVDRFPATDPNPEQEALNEELARIVRGILPVLTLRERDVLAMRHEYDRTFADIAVAFGVSTTRVRQIHAKALWMLRRELQSRAIYEMQDLL